MADGEWDVYLVNEVRDWIDGLDDASHARVVQAIDLLAEIGPGLVDSIHSSSITNLRELRPGTVRSSFSSSTPGDRPSCSSPETKPDNGMPGTAKRSR